MVSGSLDREQFRSIRLAVTVRDVNAEQNQVWSLSSFEVIHQPLTNDLNQVLSVFLLVISSTALANNGLHELTHVSSLLRPFIVIRENYRGTR